MADVLKRKCAHCKEEILVDRNSIDNVLQYDGKYYHIFCFEEMASEKAASKRGKPAKWQAALNDLQTLKSETKSIIEYSWIRDDLNDWLLMNYDIAAVPSRFWQVIAELEQGKYKGKKCKPIKIETVLGVWQWGQKKLNDISYNNKQLSKGPKNDNDRIAYDLAILVQKVPQFLAYQEKQRVAKEEMVQYTTFDDIDMSKIGRGKQIKRRDISDISDDIFVE